MRKPNLNTIKVKSELIDGKVVVTYEKTCPFCGKRYTTTAAKQKYCSDECCQKYNKRVRESRKRYDEIKNVERIRVRAHGLAVAVMEELVNLGVVEKKCSCCGSTEHLEIHHRDLNFLNDTPSNLVWLCNKCHCEAHSKLEAELKEKGILLSEYYEQSMIPFMKVLNKNSSEL